MLPDRFLIRSADTGASLELRNPTRQFYTAILEDGALSATERVNHLAVHGPGDGLADYFADLAGHWKGWSGAKQWQSIEGELTLSASRDRAGHIELLVDLQHGAPFQWSARTRLALEAVQLDHLARGAALFATELARAV